MPPNEINPSDEIRINAHSRIDIRKLLNKEHHSIMSGCAIMIMDFIFDENSKTTPGVNKVDLLDAEGYPVKTLTGSWQDRVDTGSSIKRTFIAEDTSTDTYTFRKAMLKSADDTYALLLHEEAEDKTKPSDQKVVVKWEVEIPYEV